jgi:aconitate hydratase
VKIRHDPSLAPRPGGGQQAEETFPDERTLDTSRLTESEMLNNRPTPNRVARASSVAPGAASPAAFSELAHGDVVIAAITSCTNTSNPAVMLAAGLLAKKAAERGLSSKPWVKTSLAPGSRVVSEYLKSTGLQPFLDRLGFQLVGFGCTTCIGNSGPLDREIEDAIQRHGLIVASVLSGNRNFEARIHQSVKANFLMSPPLVVAFAIAGRVDIDLTREPLGLADGRPVYLRDVWPSSEEVGALLESASNPAEYRRVYADFETQNPFWNQIPKMAQPLYPWEPGSLYIREPPYFEASFSRPSAFDVSNARALAIFGDSITTDHISPAGAIKPTSAAGAYLQQRGVSALDFNSYGARRGNHEVMVRGTFANVRIRNQMVPGVEGGVTCHQPSGERIGIYEAAERYRAEGVPLIVIAGADYGAGSSRDWAAKGTRLLGVRAVIARGFERIHRSNLVGMGVLPFQLPEGVSAQSLGLDGSERFDLLLDGPLAPHRAARLVIHRGNLRQGSVPIVLRIDTPIEVAYVAAGGILQYIVEQLLAS